MNRRALRQAIAFGVPATLPASERSPSLLSSISLLSLPFLPQYDALCLMSHSKRSTCSSGTPPSIMKKPKSQPHAFPTDSKNGVRRIGNDDEGVDSMLIDGVTAESMIIDDDLKAEAANASAIAVGAVGSSRNPTTGVAANLSRKKATPPQPAKKLVIRLVKDKPKLPANFEENTWGTLKSAITAIFLKRPDPCDSEKLYQAVSDLCLHKMGGNLYKRIQQECESYISAALQSLVGQSPDLVVFLSLVEKCWQDFCNQMLMIRGIALYLDRTYVKQTPSVRSLWDMGLQLFRKHLSSAPEVEHKTVTGLLRLIAKERLGEAIDRTLVNHLLKMFTALGTYSESFEKPFLEFTSEFYASEGVKYMQQSDVPDYLKHVESRLHEEHERCLLYLDPSTRKPLVAAAERQLLERHISAILDKGFTLLMNGNRIEDIQRMYVLFSRVNALESLRQALTSYIRGTGQGMVMDEEKDKDLVPCLLDFKASLDRIWEESFSRNEAFSNTIKDAFEHLINLRQNRPAELIAKFLDEKLRAGNKGTSEEELEGILDKVLGKDVFEAFYKKDLAKRLLLGKSASIDAEKSMISKLKTECGSQFTNKLEGMFKDIELSKEINESFKQSSQARTKLPSGIEMSVHVLTTGYWPTYPPMDVRLPHELNVYQDIFKEFYLSKHSGRRLMWQNSLGHCVLKAEFPKGKKELAVSLFQTVVLMLFNDAQKLSFQDIKDSTCIEDKELRRTLQSLACGKVRVLQKPNVVSLNCHHGSSKDKKLWLDFDAVCPTTLLVPTKLGIGHKRRNSHWQYMLACYIFVVVLSLSSSKHDADDGFPKGREVDDEDSFLFNEEFSAPLYRIKVNAIQMKETVEENASTTERVFQDRQYQVDAAIVRIMKTRKVLSHTLLITELFQQLKFPIKPADLKKRIESLIDREYLERDKSNPQSARDGSVKDKPKKQS
ncbi:Cullin-4 [Asimina triloba]